MYDLEPQLKAYRLSVLLLLLLLLGTALTGLVPVAGAQVCDADTSEGPMVEIITPADKDTVFGAVKVIARVPECSCTGSTELRVDGRFHEDGHGFDTMSHGGKYQLFVHYFNTYLFSNGVYDLTVMGKHREYNHTITVTVNNSVPAKVYYPDPILVYPFNNTKVQGKVTVTSLNQVCNCTDRPTIYVDGTAVKTLDSSAWVIVFGMNFEQFQYDLDTTKLADGKHTVRVDDKHGGSGAEIVLDVDNSGYQGDDDDDDDDDDIAGDDDDNDDNGEDDEEGVLAGPYRHAILAVPALVLAAVFVILILIIMKYEKGKKGKEAGDDGDD